MVSAGAESFDGRYTLEDVLGSGGTGTVHRAWDTVLDRPVALKLLRTGVADDDVHRARLRAEAQLAGALHHPAIAQIYDYGEAPGTGAADEPTPYIVMQFIDGVPLSAVLKERRRLPADVVMSVVAQVADALQVAHERGIVHRDLKPGNILLSPDGRPVLVDFGIARSADLEPLTMTGTIVGTVDYISPEQTSGGSATPLSDLYSLGMVAYEALSGRRPFRRESQVATALAHLHDEVPPLEDDVPPAVRDLVLRMVAKDPGSRPQTAAEVAQRADALAADPAAPVAPFAQVVRVAALVPEATAATTTTTTPARPWVRTKRTYVGAALLTAAVAISFFVAARPAVVRVPDVAGMRMQAAVQALHERDLDEVERTFVDDPQAERGTVLGQRPEPGSTSDDATVVVLEVASGRAEVVADDLIGDGYTEAAREVVALGLVPMRRETSQATGIGTVAGVAPTGRLPLGSTVTLTVAVAVAR